MKYTFIPFILFISLFFPAVSNNRWIINNDGSTSWIINNGDKSHYDHIEMSGQQVSTVVRYGVNDDGSFSLSRGMVWPMLRTIPNNTHASLMESIDCNPLNGIKINDSPLNGEKVRKISLNGTVVVESTFPESNIELTRYLFPSVLNPSFCEKYIIKNTGSHYVNIEVIPFDSVKYTDHKKGVDGSYKIVVKFSGFSRKVLKPGDSISFYGSVSAYKLAQKQEVCNIDNELEARRKLVAEFENKLILESPDITINTMFDFAKIRASESIYKTKGGFMHGPGGESYYAAIWANDQAEYVNPFFPYLGYGIGNESALNSYRMFARYMNPKYKALPSSIIAEGTDIWDGAGDRGDAAMIAYGASRYVLARGDRNQANELWSLIEWCLEYCRRNMNKEGVVMSNTDELEGRFPSGNANLCTSSLYYDALVSASMLGNELGKPKQQVDDYYKQAQTLRNNIDKYFGGKVDGFDTYRYYKGNKKLRSWICIPLTVNIYDRKEATINALFSEKLWTENGLLTEEGSNTYWDRSTLYALRGVIACGEIEKGLKYLEYYSNKRLLGEHVPYAIEAWPEGGKRHLSAESGLYCRIITEGLFGMRPTGLNSFTMTPRLPKKWNYMSLKNVEAYNHEFNIDINRIGNKISVKISSHNNVLFKKIIKDGENVNVAFKD